MEPKQTPGMYPSGISIEKSGQNVQHFDVGSEHEFPSLTVESSDPGPVTPAWPRSSEKKKRVESVQSTAALSVTSAQQPIPEEPKKEKGKEPVQRAGTSYAAVTQTPAPDSKPLPIREVSLPEGKISKQVVEQSFTSSSLSVVVAGSSEAITRQDITKKSFSEALSSKPAAPTQPAQPLTVSSKHIPIHAKAQPLINEKAIYHLIKNSSPMALKYAKELYLLDKTSSNYLSLYIRTLRLAGHYTDACKEIEDWKSRSPDTKLPYNIALNYVMVLDDAGKREQALEQIDKTLRNMPRKHKFYCQFIKLKSTCLFNLDRVEEACNLLEVTIGQEERSDEQSIKNFEILLQPLLYYTGRIQNEFTNDSFLHKKAQRIQSLYARYATPANETSELVQAFELLDNKMASNKIRELKDAHEKTSSLLEDPSLNRYVQKSYQFRLARYQAEICWREGKTEEAIKLGEEQLTKAIDFLKILQKENPLAIPHFFKAFEKFTIDHSKRMTSHKVDGVELATKRLNSFFQARKTYHPDMPIMSTKYVKLLPFYLSKKGPDSFREVLEHLHKDSLAVKVAKIRLDLQIQLDSGTIFGDIPKRVAELLTLYPGSVSVRLLEGDLALQSTLVAFDKNKDDRYETCEKAKEILDKLIKSTNHHSACTWRGHLASIENKYEESRFYHEKARELYLPKASRSFMNTIESWYEKKDQAALEYLSER